MDVINILSIILTFVYRATYIRFLVNRLIIKFTEKVKYLSLKCQHILFGHKFPTNRFIGNFIQPTYII